MLKLIINSPLKIKMYISKLIELQNNIHNIILNNNQFTFKKYLKYALDKNKHLEYSEVLIVKKYIDNLPDGNNLCHGDFHPDNILYDKKYYYIID
jgi:thiamine kinase-like enzyme